MRSTYRTMFDMFSAWQKESNKYKSGEITKEEYDAWRYKYPELDTTGKWTKILPQELSDMLVEALNDEHE